MGEKVRRLQFRRLILSLSRSFVAIGDTSAELRPTRTVAFMVS